AVISSGCVASLLYPASMPCHIISSSIARSSAPRLRPCASARAASWSRTPVSTRIVVMAINEVYVNKAYVELPPTVRRQSPVLSATRRSWHLWRELACGAPRQRPRPARIQQEPALDACTTTVRENDLDLLSIERDSESCSVSPVN